MVKDLLSIIPPVTLLELPVMLSLASTVFWNMTLLELPVSVNFTEPLYIVSTSELPVSVTLIAQFAPGMFIVMLSELPVIETPLWFVICMVCFFELPTTETTGPVFDRHPTLTVAMFDCDVTWLESVIVA